MNTTATAETKKGIDLDELQRETERLLSLLRDRQPGLMSWNEFMHEQLTKLHALAAQALSARRRRRAEERARAAQARHRGRADTAT